MGFFRRSEASDVAADESLARIEAGGITVGAEDRLKALSADGALFTSGLSVKEFTILHRLGPRPLAQVMGASVVRTGWQYLPALPPGVVSYGAAGSSIGGSAWSPMNNRVWMNPITEPSCSQLRNYKWHTEVVCELDTLTAAWNLARRRALDRLNEEALQVGADAVVGVHLHRSDHDLGAGTIDYVVSGTAIRLPGSTQKSWPLLTDVSVQDYSRLLGAGQEPAGLLAATAVVFASPPRSTRAHRARTTWRNRELEEISQAFGLARKAIRERLEGQVADAHADGAVGVEFSHSVRREKLSLASSLQTVGHRGWNVGRLGIPYWVSGHSDVERRGWVITMHGAGTAVRRQPGPAAPATVKTTLRMGAK